MPAGSKLIFQMHYTPNGSPQDDRSYCGFVFTEPDTVKKEVRVTSAINAVFEIPPGNSDFPVKARYIFTEDSLLLTLMPHMHLRGKAFRYEATYPDGKKEVLLDVPHYDFGWQTNYRLAEPKFMPRGTRMDCYAKFDNSDDNLNNPDPSTSVRFGDQTWEEMMIGFFEQAPADEDRTDPNRKYQPLTRLERFNVIMAATKGEPDENVKAIAYMALVDPEFFHHLDDVLQIMVPQVDRVCITTVKDGKLVEVMGPGSGRHQHGHADDGGGEEEVAQAVLEARKLREKMLAESFQAPLPPTDAEGEDLASYITSSKPVVNNDLTKAKGKLMERMVKRGIKSSFHVPAEVNGQKVTINFWSRDKDAFPPMAEAVLTGVAQIMTAPKGNAQAAAK